MAEYVAPEAEDAYVVFEDDGAPPPDLDAPLIEHRYERTTPKEVGAPYDMAAWIRADRARREAEGTFDPGGHSEIIARGWWADWTELPRAPKPIAKRLVDAGWEVRCCCSIVYVTETLFVAANEKHAKGEVRYGDHDDTRWSIQAVLRRPAGPAAALWATWVTREEVGRKTATKYEDAITWDPVLGREYQGKAGEFGDWLSIFCP